MLMVNIEAACDDRELKHEQGPLYAQIHLRLALEQGSRAA